MGDQNKGSAQDPAGTPGEEQQNALESFMDEVEKEGGDPFEHAEDPNTTPPDPSAGDEDEKEDPEPDGDGDSQKPEDEDDQVPFHKHPRFQKVTRENRELKERVEEFEKFVQDQKNSPQSDLSKADVHVPPWLKDLFGDNPEAYANFDAYNKGLVQQVTNTIVNQQTQMTNQQEQQKAKLVEQVKAKFESLEEEHGKIDRHAIGKIAIELKPTDDNGDISITKAHDIWQEREELKQLKSKDPAKAHARKQIAAKTTPGSGGGNTGAPKILTPEDLRGKSMHDLI